MRHVDFVSYYGSYPTLCTGILHLIINGVHWFFGNFDDIDKITDFAERSIALSADSQWSGRFWFSGGSVTETGDVVKGDWIADMDLLPDYLKFYTNEIIGVMNNFVEHGCCGGCSFYAGGVNNE